MKLQHDPLNTAASKDDLKRTRLEIFNLPIKTSDGHVFQFDGLSEKYMKSTLDALGNDDFEFVDWILVDNRQILCSKKILQEYFNELTLLKSKRSVQLTNEYLTLKKNNDLTLRDLANWAKKYQN
ncbi:hypothetical protein [Agarilytica rhodophyticola]|uniref:hypothetical protein n=1 Tax=Agarilytica rhodophyticola TaxID=1737490 RepID=UPI000B3495BC|nr:hypothetical protein [Agarilytica rhodophyticola]